MSKDSMDAESIYNQACELTSKADNANALLLYKQLVEAKEDARFFIAYGVCLQKLGHWKQSILPLEKGIDLKPHYCEGDARLVLAESYLNAGYKSKAIAQWKLV